MYSCGSLASEGAFGVGISTRSELASPGAFIHTVTIPPARALTSPRHFEPHTGASDCANTTVLRIYLGTVPKHLSSAPSPCVRVFTSSVASLQRRYQKLLSTSLVVAFAVMKAFFKAIPFQARAVLATRRAGRVTIRWSSSRQSGPALQTTLGRLQFKHTALGFLAGAILVGSGVTVGFQHRSDSEPQTTTGLGGTPPRPGTRQYADQASMLKVCFRFSVWSASLPGTLGCGRDPGVVGNWCS